jgi:hypothetical protein
MSSPNTYQTPRIVSSALYVITEYLSNAPYCSSKNIETIFRVLFIKMSSSALYDITRILIKRPVLFVSLFSLQRCSIYITKNIETRLGRIRRAFHYYGSFGYVLSSLSATLFKSSSNANERPLMSLSAFSSCCPSYKGLLSPVLCSSSSNANERPLMSLSAFSSCCASYKGLLSPVLCSSSSSANKDDRLAGSDHFANFKGEYGYLLVGLYIYIGLLGSAGLLRLYVSR